MRVIWLLVYAAGLSLGGFGITLTSIAQNVTTGLLGRPLASVEQTSFFNFFNLEQVAGRADDGHRLLEFKPTGAKFRPLITVEITTNSEGTVMAMELLLTRAFVDSPSDGVFARDIAKSFVREVPSREDAEEIGDLANEIEFKPSPAPTMLVGPGYHKPKLPDKPTPGYQAFTGQRKSYARTLGHSSLAIVNENGTGAFLRITFRVKPYAAK